MPQHGVFDDRIRGYVEISYDYVDFKFQERFNIQFIKTSYVCTLMAFRIISLVFKFLIRHIWWELYIIS
jgi:hypothetical protein